MERARTALERYEIYAWDWMIDQERGILGGDPLLSLRQFLDEEV
jgi:hypothetical protein